MEPYGYTIFCDDIRTEISKKLIFIGVYAGQMSIHRELPWKMPKFCFAIHYVVPKGEPMRPYELQIYLPGDPDDSPSLRADIGVGEPTDLVQQAGESQEDGVWQRNVLMTAESLEIKQEGWIKVRAVEDGRTTRLGALLVMKAPQHGDMPAET